MADYKPLGPPIPGANTDERFSVARDGKAHLACRYFIGPEKFYPPTPYSTVSKSIVVHQAAYHSGAFNTLVF